MDSIHVSTCPTLRILYWGYADNWLLISMSTRMHVLCGSGDYGFFGTFTSELFGLFTLFMLWLVGAAIASVRPSSLSALYSGGLTRTVTCDDRACGETFHGVTNTSPVGCSQSSSRFPGWDGSSSARYLSSVFSVR